MEKLTGGICTRAGHHEIKARIAQYIGRQGFPEFSAQQLVLLTSEHRCPFAHMLSRRPSRGSQVGNACPEEGSVGPSTMLRAVSSSNGDPVKTECFRLILRARAIDGARRFHGGQSCVVCGGSPKKRSPHGLERALPAHPGVPHRFCTRRSGTKAFTGNYRNSGSGGK